MPGRAGLRPTQRACRNNGLYDNCIGQQGLMRGQRAIGPTQRPVLLKNNIEKHNVLKNHVYSTLLRVGNHFCTQKVAYSGPLRWKVAY